MAFCRPEGFSLRSIAPTASAPETAELGSFLSTGSGQECQQFGEGVTVDEWVCVTVNSDPLVVASFEDFGGAEVPPTVLVVPDESHSGALYHDQPSDVSGDTAVDQLHGAAAGDELRYCSTLARCGGSRPDRDPTERPHDRGCFIAELIWAAVPVDPRDVAVLYLPEQFGHHVSIGVHSSQCGSSRTGPLVRSCT